MPRIFATTSKDVQPEGLLISKIPFIKASIAYIVGFSGGGINGGIKGGGTGGGAAWSIVEAVLSAGRPGSLGTSPGGISGVVTLPACGLAEGLITEGLIIALSPPKAEAAEVETAGISPRFRSMGCEFKD